MKLTLLTKPSCSLCDAMREVVARVGEDYDLEVAERDVMADDGLVHLEYAVPLLMADGLPLFRFRVSEAALGRVLEERGCPRRHD